MPKSKYLVIEKTALPEVYDKVLLANSLMDSGEAKSTSEAVKIAGISRSVYYKYKDSVFSYSEKHNSGLLNLQLVLEDRPGVLVSLLSKVYESGGNILTVNQNIPIRNRAFVSLSVSTNNLIIDIDELLLSIKSINGVISIDSLSV